MSRKRGLKDVAELEDKAEEAVQFLKHLTNRHRLMILCALIEAEQSVTELVDKLPISQSATSQHLAKMREEGLIRAQRDRQRIVYSLVDPTVESILAVLVKRFC